MLLIVSFSNLVDISSCPELDFGFNLAETHYVPVFLAVPGAQLFAVVQI